MERRPGNDGCEGCYHWWEEHHRRLLTWPEHVQKYNEEATHKTAVDLAQKVSSGELKRDFEPEAVLEGTETKGYVTRMCMIANDAELRSFSKLRYIAQRKLPSDTMEVPKDVQGLGSVYVRSYLIYGLQFLYFCSF